MDSIIIDVTHFPHVDTVFFFNIRNSYGGG